MQPLIHSRGLYGPHGTLCWLFSFSKLKMQRCSITGVIHLVQPKKMGLDGWYDKSGHPNTQVAGLDPVLEKL
jgi:hypothetical protein